MARKKLRPDLRNIASYGIPEAAHYLALSEGTLRSWVFGRRYSTSSGIKTSKPLIVPADAKHETLSFYNLVEAHILMFTRQVYGIRMNHVRSAIDYVRSRTPDERPLITQVFYTDGKHLFVKELESIIDASKMGQLGIREMLDLYLQRIDWDSEGFAARLYPVRATSHKPRSVVIDPQISFGRPVIAGTGITASVLWHRKRLGEKIDDISKDYGLDKVAVEEAISYYQAA
jgi:uncharacterized protein (DUF433 family)